MEGRGGGGGEGGRVPHQRETRPQLLPTGIRLCPACQSTESSTTVCSTYEPAISRRCREVRCHTTAMPSQVGTQSCSLSALPSRPGPGVGGIRCCTWSARAAASQCEAQRPGGRRVGGTYRLVAVNRSPNAQAPSRVKIATPWQNQWQSVSDVHCFLPCTHARADAFPRTRLRCRSGAASRCACACGHAREHNLCARARIW